jgi:flagellar FliJ protein
MRRFRFNLEKVLELRRHKEREWELKLAKITGECLSLQQQIEQRSEEIVRMMNARRQQGGRIDMQEMLSNEFFIVRLNKENEQLAEELEVKEIKRQEVQQKYSEVSRERKVIDKLKEKRAAEYYQMVKREEVNQLDDQNNSRFGRE